MLRAGRSGGKRWLSTLNTGVNAETVVVKHHVQHPLRTFLWRASLSLGVFYAGGLALSNYNDKVNHWFTSYVPFAEDILDTYDSYRRRAAFKADGLYSYGSGDVVSTTPVSVLSSAVSPTAPKEILELDVVELEPDALHPSLYDLVSALTDLSAAISNQKIVLDKQDVNDIQDRYGVLFNKVIEYNRNLQYHISSNVAAETQETVAKLENDYKEALARQELEMREEFIKEFNGFKAQLEKKMSETLESDLKANEQALLAKHANEVALLSITQVKEFTKILKEKLDTERAGRLGHLEELDKSINDFATSLDKLNSRLTKNEAVSQILITLDQMKNKLQHSLKDDGTVQENILLSKDVRRLQTLLDILPRKSSCKCASCQGGECHCTSKACQSKQKSGLMDAAFSSLQTLAADEPILTNDQLYSRWCLLEDDFKTASLLPPNSGILGHITAKLFSTLLFTKKGISPSDNDMDSIFARVSENIRLSRLDKALEDVVALQGWPHVLCKDWVVAARRKLEVEALVDVLNSELKTL